MLEIEIPGREIFIFEHLVLDMNGTIATDGTVSEAILKRIQKLSTLLTVHVVTADTHGRFEAQRERIPATIYKISSPNEAKQKADYLDRLGALSSIAIGNGANDVEMLKKGKLSIAVLGREGCSIMAMMSADIVTANAVDALDLVLNANRLIATLRI